MFSICKLFFQWMSTITLILSSHNLYSSSIFVKKVFKLLIIVDFLMETYNFCVKNSAYLVHINQIIIFIIVVYILWKVINEINKISLFKDTKQIIYNFYWVNRIKIESKTQEFNYETINYLLIVKILFYSQKKNIQS